jgi:hypothetical protein
MNSQEPPGWHDVVPGEQPFFLISGGQRLILRYWLAGNSVQFTVPLNPGTNEGNDAGVGTAVGTAVAGPLGTALGAVLGGEVGGATSAPTYTLTFDAELQIRENLADNHGESSPTLCSDDALGWGGAWMEAHNASSKPADDAASIDDAVATSIQTC